MLFVQYITYFSLAIATILIIAKLLRYAMAPEHFRWELYPVPHEKGRSEYGGSYLEELDWWRQPRHNDRLKEIKEMMSEIFLLKGVFHHNKRVWISSFPFHLGLYICIGWLALLFLGGIFQLSGVPVTASSNLIPAALYYLTIISGYAGFILTILGALGLLYWRISNKQQRGYSAPIDFFNLILCIAVAGIALISHLTADANYSILRAYVQSLISFSPAAIPGNLMTAEILLISFIIVYIPLTRMSHFVAKYFLYHAVRWNDEPNKRGSRIEKSIIKLLNQKVSWNAPHMHTGKTWKEVIKETNNE